MLMDLFAWVAAALVFATFFMKTIVPLRTLAIASNVAFIGYAALGVSEGIFAKVLPILVLHAALLPLNLVRLREVKGTSRVVRATSSSAAPFEFLIPFMTEVSFPSGHVLFHKEDKADHVYMIKSGAVSLNELGKRLGPGSIFGEVAVFSDKARRTATAECCTDCFLFRISGEKMVELFYQDRQFSFRIARLLAGYA